MREVPLIDIDSKWEDLPVGILSKYADPEKRELEDGAFECAVMDKYVKNIEANTK